MALAFQSSLCPLRIALTRPDQKRQREDSLGKVEGVHVSIAAEDKLGHVLRSRRL